MLDVNELSGTFSCDPRREILRHIAGMLLESDPRTLRAVMRGLSSPSVVSAKNVIFLASVRQRNCVFHVSVSEALSNSPRLRALARTLIDGGIRTLGQLVSSRIETLCARFGLERDLLESLDAVCGKYGLQMGMRLRGEGVSQAS
jgi:hypothetical protein